MGRSFPCEVSFPNAGPSQLHSITHIEVNIWQIVWFLSRTDNPNKPRLLAKDSYPITATAELQPSTNPVRVSLPLPDPIIHGRFTSSRLRVRHQLQIIFHRKWFLKNVTWEGEVEIFHRDVGWESRGIQGVMETVRGQEGDFWPDGTEVKALPSAEEKP